MNVNTCHSIARNTPVRSTVALLFFCIFLSLLSGGAIQADLVVDDHFDDGTGAPGAPADWTELAIGSAGTIVESPSGASSAVVLNDPVEATMGGPLILRSLVGINTTVASPTVMTVSVDSLTGTDPTRSTFLGYINNPLSNFFAMNLRRNDPAGTYNLRVQGGTAGGGGGTERNSDLGDFTWDGLSALTLTFTFDLDSFSVEAAGGFVLIPTDMLYNTSFTDSMGVPDPTFNPLTGLGIAAFPTIVTDPEGMVGETSILQVDRIVVNGAQFIPEPSALAYLGLVSLGWAGWRRRRRA